MTLQEILASLLNPNGMQQAQPMPQMAPQQVGDHGAPFMPQSRLAAPPQAPQRASVPMAPQGQPTQQSAPQATADAGYGTGDTGGGIGGLLQSMFAPHQAQKNATVQWLQSQGYDQGTATILASDKGALRQVIMNRGQRDKPIEINGRLVDPTDYHVLADFSTPPTPDKPPASYQEYQLAKNDGFKGTYTDWQTKSIREQDPTFSREKDLRQEYENNPNVKSYQIVRDNYERIRQGAQIGTGAGDLAIVFGYMKMLDPTSVVREGEQAAASDVSGVPSRIRNLYNSVVAGAKLPPEARQELLAAATEVYTQSSKNLGDLNTRYGGIAKNYQLDPARIIQPAEQYDPLGTVPGDPATVTPGGKRVLQQMTDPNPMGGGDGWQDLGGGVRVRKIN